MSTQADIIESERVALQVIAQLNLTDDAVLRARWLEKGQSEGMERWLAESLRKNLVVTPSRGSSVLSISYRGDDPQKAAAIANAFAQAYIKTTIELRAAPAKEYAQWFIDQGKQARLALESAQAKLSVYQQESGIVFTDDKLDAEMNKLNELSSQLAVVQGESAASAGKRKLIDSADSLPEVIQNPLIQNLKSELIRIESQMQESGRNFGSNHPLYLQQQAQASAVRERLAGETRRIVDSIITSNLASREKENQLNAAILEQKQRILELKGQRDTLAVLEHDVASAQKAYDEISHKITQTTLESQTTLTNVAMLTNATAPLNPSSPRVILNMLGALFLGVLLGGSMAMLREYFDRRIRGGVDLSVALSVPVLAEFKNKFQLPADKQVRKQKPKAKQASISKPKMAVPAHVDDIS